MAKIKNSEPKSSSGGCARVFGIDALGHLISRVHATNIINGKELEKMIKDRVERIDDLDKFLEIYTTPDKVLLADKKQIKECKTLKFYKYEPDFLIFKWRDNQPHCYVIELKDGHQFDTKKASAEHREMRKFVERNSSNISCRMTTHFCCFNQDSRDAIYEGFKRKISKAEVMTSREFCDLLEIDYDEIVARREADQEPNVDCFLKELTKIDEVRDISHRLLQDEDNSHSSPQQNLL